MPPAIQEGNSLLFIYAYQKRNLPQNGKNKVKMKLKENYQNPSDSDETDKAILFTKGLVQSRQDESGPQQPSNFGSVCDERGSILKGEDERRSCCSPLAVPTDSMTADRDTDDEQTVVSRTPIVASAANPNLGDSNSTWEKFRACSTNTNTVRSATASESSSSFLYMGDAPPVVCTGSFRSSLRNRRLCKKTVNPDELEPTSLQPNFGGGFTDSLSSPSPARRSFNDPFPTPTKGDFFSCDGSVENLDDLSRRRLSLASTMSTASTVESSDTEWTDSTHSGQPLSPLKLRRRAVSAGLRSSWQNTSQRIRNTSQRIRNTSKRIRRLRLRRPRERATPWLIPSHHPLKVAWDICTVLLSALSAYLTHTSIRDRDYDKGEFLIRFCEFWFFVDILLNFVTQNQVSGRPLVSAKSVWARYLTTWFVVDVLSLLPWEKLWVKPIVEKQKRRNFLQKMLRRSKVTFKVTRMLRGRHIRWFRHVARQTRHAGVGWRRLLQIIIKYTPKYFVFLKNMKAILAVRFLRQIHWCRKVVKNVYWKGRDVESEEENDEDDDDAYVLDEDEYDLNGNPSYYREESNSTLLSMEDYTFDRAR